MDYIFLICIGIMVVFVVGVEIVETIIERRNKK